LWPRLDRSKISRVADDPNRIAEIIERRTSQPLDVILAMLTRQAPVLSSSPDTHKSHEGSRQESTHVALRIVRSEEGGEIQVQDLLPA
jgi:hypothetical protein